MPISTAFSQKIFSPKPTLVNDLYLACTHIFDLVNLYRCHANNEIYYHNILFSIALAAAPVTIVELGTGPGVSSLAFIRVLEYYNRIRKEKGTLHSCDLDPVTQLPLHRYGQIVKLHLMKTDQLAELWATHQSPIDILYIDADHSHEQSIQDFKNFAPFIKPNGLAIMHDTHPVSVGYEQLHLSGTAYQTAQDIKKDYREDFEIMTIPYLNGISLVRKKGSKYF
jgi:predicted O-methyltransferase YrrM